MKFEKIIKGIVHWSDGSLLIRSIGRTIDISRDNGNTFEFSGRIELDLIRRIASWNRIGRRLTRSNVKHCLRLTEDLFIVFVASSILQLDLKSKQIRKVATVSGSRPLRVCFDGQSLYYGEYRRNPSRQPIHVWKSVNLGLNWEICHTFTNVRHIHGVYHDPFDKAIWITTGDLDHESAIWRTDNNFGDLQRVVGGTQQHRVIDLLFSPSHLFFGSDAPDQQNCIYNMSRVSGRIESLVQTAGPIFHAASYSNHLFFTTACEPSTVNMGQNCEIWHCDTTGHCQRVGQLRKDRWPAIFQYGQIILPAGQKSQIRFWVSPFATKYDQTSLLIGTSDN